MWDHGVKGLDVPCVEEVLAGVIVVKLKSSKDLKSMVSVLGVSAVSMVSVLVTMSW